MKKTLVATALLLCMARAAAQTVEVEMTTLKQLADDCSVSLSGKRCGVASACYAFKEYRLALMPDGAAGYYEEHGRDRSMNPGNGKLVAEAIKAT